MRKCFLRSHTTILYLKHETWLPTTSVTTIICVAKILPHKKAHKHVTLKIFCCTHHCRTVHHHGNCCERLPHKRRQYHTIYYHPHCRRTHATLSWRFRWRFLWARPYCQQLPKLCYLLARQQNTDAYPLQTSNPSFNQSCDATWWCVRCGYT